MGRDGYAALTYGILLNVGELKDLEKNLIHNKSDAVIKSKI